MAMPAPRLVRSDSWLDSVEESFERALLRQDLSPKTVRSYGIGIKNFFAFLRDQGVDDLHHLTREHLENWQDAMRERVPPLKAGSRSLYSTAVKQLIRWAADRDIVDLKLERAIVGVRTRHRSDQETRQPISEEDLARLMAYLGPRRARMTVVDLRDRALFFVLLATGARVNEALQMPRAGFEHSRVRQKGGSYIELELTPSAVDFVHDYLRARSDELPWLWVAHGNHGGEERQLADSGVREAWRRLCYRLSIERFTTHQLRHTSATVLLEGNVDHLAVANHLHHADTRTVHRYAKVRDRVRQKTLDVMENFITDNARTRPQLLERKMPPGGRPRYRLS
jgi:site-specific recombinase XerD